MNTPPRGGVLLPKRQMIIAQNFYFIFLFFPFVSCYIDYLVVCAIKLIQLRFNMYGYYSFPVYVIFYTTYYISLI
nr:MAG TPA: hypothetical protein [Caudoviricetes sp.]